MKKIYVLIFVILILGLKSCTNAEKEIVFIRGEKLNAIGEVSFLNDIRDSEFNVEEVTLSNEEEFLGYIEENLDSKNSKNKLFVISDLFSNSSLDERFNDNRLVYINSNKNNVFNLKIDQRYISYIFGIVSGMVTRNNNISIVYSNELESSFDNVLAFIFGVKQVNPRVYDALKSWDNVLDLSLVELDNRLSVVSEFINGRGSDIIFNLDYELINEISNIVEENMKLLVTLDEFEENIFLDVDYKYDEIIRDILKGNVKTYFVNPIDNFIEINFDKLPEEIRNKVEINLNKVILNNNRFPMSIEELKN